MRERFCENCGRWIEDNEQLYLMTITIQANPGPIELNEPDAEADLLGELQKLVEHMEQMSPDQVEEATDQVHESYRYTLCPDCREEMHTRLKRREQILEE